MPRDNVEIVRTSVDAFVSREFDRAVEVWHPDGEFRPAMASAVEQRVYRGHQDLRRYFDELFGSFSEVRLDDLEFREVGDRVLVLYQLRVRGLDSDVTIEQPGGVVYELRDGKISSGRSYLSRPEALRAV